ncbi:hypothetical protein ABIE69_000045 [Rhodobacteraceae bacterium MBR-64]|jgi:hypothetical protein
MMTRFLVSVTLASLALSACGVVDMPSRSANVFDSAASPAAFADTALAPRAGYVIEDVRIAVPQSLRVSEANVYFPLADIVWRGDPYGDRRAQVAQIFRDGFAKAAPALVGGPKVVVDVEVQRFHAVTEKARYAFGGVHSVQFVMTVRDAATGAILSGPRPVKADMRASGGSSAIAEDARGYTQRVAITRHLAEVVARELALPGAPMGKPVLSSRGSGAALPIATARSDVQPHRLFIE